MKSLSEVIEKYRYGLSKTISKHIKSYKGPKIARVSQSAV